MPRPTRKRLKFDEESVNMLLQEIYEDSFNIKAKIIRLMNKWEVKVRDAGEIAALGDSIIKLIGAEAKNQDQKIMLLKYLKEVVFDKRGVDDPNKPPVDTEAVSADRRNELLQMVQDEIDKKNNKK